MNDSSKYEIYGRYTLVQSYIGVVYEYIGLYRDFIISVLSSYMLFPAVVFEGFGAEPKGMEF